MWWLWTAYAVSTAGTWLAVGAVVAVPLGPWVEVRAKRPVMIAMDLVRFVAVLSVPVAFVLGWLSFAQLLVVSITVVAADITFTARGPPLGTAALGVFGPWSPWWPTGSATCPPRRCCG